ncbi:hypothetical protein BD309DRAFT_197057 [Dichomitus squalens]|nr:hypothetical protein BD309DRAFT_197057 [Dichomitus squalens]
MKAPRTRTAARRTMRLANKDRAENGAVASHPRRANIHPVFSPGYGHTVPAPASARDKSSSFRGPRQDSELFFLLPFPDPPDNPYTHVSGRPLTVYSPDVLAFLFFSNGLQATATHRHAFQSLCESTSGIARSREARAGPAQQPIDYLDIVGLIHGSEHPSDIASPSSLSRKLKSRCLDAESDTRKAHGAFSLALARATRTTHLCAGS